MLQLWTSLLPDWSGQAAAGEPAWLVPQFYDPAADRFPVSIHSWLLRTPRHTILIDTCAGNAKPRPTFRLLDQLETPYLQNLAQAGVTPAEVDYVICTHLHVDHVGWNTRLEGGRWVPTFPKAQYLLPRLDCESADRRGALYRDSILPVIESGQARFVEGDERLMDEMQLVPARGHSPGQMAVQVRSLGDEAMFTGDVVHHPLQIRHPEWNSNLCEDADMARRTRRRILEHCAQNGSRIFPAHFANPHYGRVSLATGQFDFVPGGGEA